MTDKRFEILTCRWNRALDELALLAIEHADLGFQFQQDTEFEWSNADGRRIGHPRVQRGSFCRLYEPPRAPTEDEAREAIATVLAKLDRGVAKPSPKPTVADLTVIYSTIHTLQARVEALESEMTAAQAVAEKLVSMIRRTASAIDQANKT